MPNSQRPTIVRRKSTARASLLCEASVVSERGERGIGAEERSEHRTEAELVAGVDEVRRAPRGEGTLELIVARPAPAERAVVEDVQFDLVEGVVGDCWRARGSSRRADGSPDPDAQVTLMGARAAAVIAGPRERWPLAGDQLYVDLDLSGEHLPAGTHLHIGTAVLEVTAKPHTGCAKFAARFGDAAWRFVNTPVGRELNLRGIFARVVEPGLARRGDAITELLP
jgi:MOSC domain